ncbi:MAG: hypothetical protein EXR51_07370 [Dehalococcoidia bacterium]|nr:hypothetical protein [Dehalococcoidia bacterium]
MALRPLVPLFLAAFLALGFLACEAEEKPELPGDEPRHLQLAAPFDSAAIPTPPDADPYEITGRLRLKSGPIPRRASAIPTTQTQGATRSFTVTDLQSFVRSQVAATLQLVTPHAYWYVDNRIAADRSAIESSAREFEDRTYPTDIRYFGNTIRAGFDGDPRLTVLLTRFGGAAGYYGSPDEYPKAVHPFSNERLMLYINAGALPPGGRGFNSVVAHELQHALHYHADPNEESWVNEGLSTLAEELNGFRNNSASVFQAAPNVQLTAWEENPSDNALHYAAAHLFLRFLGQHYGGYDRLKELVAEPLDGTAGVDAYLARLGVKERFNDVFRDWVVANAGVGGVDERYRYDGITVKPQPSRRIEGDDEITASVHQFAARYYEVQPRAGRATIEFSGSPAVRIIPADAHSGRSFWWSNRGDLIDTTLTRTIDLTNVAKATLRFWAWHRIEKGWDYAYVTASADGGRTWEVLAGTHTSQENPLGNSYGPGYTGISGSEPQWVEETVDLSPYAGKQTLIRFEYITDEAVNADGFAIDDIQVPEAGFMDDAERDTGWEAKGFVRTANQLPQPYAVQVLEVGPGGTAKLRSMDLDPSQLGSMTVCCFGREVEKVIVAVSGMAPVTTQPAPFRLKVRVEP